MDGHRRYADEPKPSWYSGQQGQYGEPVPGAYDSGVHERPSGAFRLPEQRETDYAPPPSPYVTPDPVTSTGSHSQEHRIPVRGPEYPTVKPADPPAPQGGTVAAYNEPTGVVPPVGRLQTGGRNAMYRTRRPVSAVLVALATLVLMVPVIMMLVQSTFDDDPLASGVVPAVLLALGLPLTGLGLYSLATSGAVAREAWLRPPVVYVPVGLVMLLAAGLAVS